MSQSINSFPEACDELRDCKDITRLIFSDIYIHLDSGRGFIQNLRIPVKDDRGSVQFFKPPIISGIPDTLGSMVTELREAALSSKEKQGENWFPLSFEGAAKTASFRGQYFRYSSGEWLCLRRMDEPPVWNDLGVSDHISNVLFHLLDHGFGLRKNGHPVGGPGLFLITGPMGEGKTTTFHSLCREVTKRFGGVTVEMGNPVEFACEGFYGPEGFGRIFQVNTDDSSFGQVFYENLRMAPKRICFEEIRTASAALAALEASRSGITVIATMHATSVMEAFGRFAALAASDPNVSRELVLKDMSYSLKAILNQRLIFSETKGVEVSMNGMFVSPFDYALKTSIQDNRLSSISSSFEDQQQRMADGNDPIDFSAERDKKDVLHSNE